MRVLISLAGMAFFGCASAPPTPRPEASIPISDASCSELEYRVRDTERNISDLLRLEQPSVRQTAEDSPSYGYNNLGDSVQRFGISARVRGMTLERETAYMDALVDELRYRCW